MAGKPQRGRRADFGPFAASVFAPHLFCGSVRSQLGCGASALALLTGVPPEIISSQNGRAHYSDAFMVRFLKTRKFRTLQLTPRLISGAASKISMDHVLLISQLFRHDEGTWRVVFGDFYFHNFEPYSLSNLAFLNKPILSAYLVIHPKWRISYSTPHRRPELPAKGSRLTVARLRQHSHFAQVRT